MSITPRGDRYALAGSLAYLPGYSQESYAGVAITGGLALVVTALVAAGAANERVQVRHQPLDPRDPTSSTGPLLILYPSMGPTSACRRGGGARPPQREARWWRRKWWP